MFKLKIGDVVMLKSGGPRMTVNGFFPDRGDVRCTWAQGCQVLSERFFEDALDVKDPGYMSEEE